VTFAELYDGLTAVGLEVGVAADAGGRLFLCVADPGAEGERSIRLAVEGGFDRTAAVLVASMRMREALTSPGRVPDLRADGRECRGRWPEFLEVWPPRGQRAG
jgi:hypothetical protein